MAVEFRCPDCRAKLRLAEAPPAGEEIECPRCGTVFPAPDADAAARPARRSKPDEDEDDDEPKPKKKKKAPAAEGDKPKPKPGSDSPKRRKTKQKKSNPAVLVGAIVGGLVAVSLLVVMLVFLLGRQPAAMALMAYLPDDADRASGVNFGQFQKYPVYYKGFELMFDGPSGTKKRLEPVTTALGVDFADLVDYFVEGGRAPDSSAALIRTKKEIDPGLLAKIPGAREETVNGVKVFNVPGNLRVFAPTNRIVGIASSQIGSDTLQKMVAGNKDNKDASFIGRSGALGARVAKGNLWEVQLGGAGKARLVNSLFPTLLTIAKSDAPSDKGYDIGSIKGSGGRMTIGAKSVRFEMELWCESATRATEVSKKWNESELAKGDEGTPPLWWKNFLGEVIADRSLAPSVSSALGFSAAGELFLVRAELDVAKSMAKLPLWADRLNPKPLPKP